MCVLQLIGAVQNAMKPVASRPASPLPQTRSAARPRTPEPASSLRPPSPIATGGSGSSTGPCMRQYVLVVEDNPTNNKLLRAIISQQYDFASATNGQEALNVLAES